MSLYKFKVLRNNRKLRFNPIPIKSLKLFPKIQIQYLYHENDKKIKGIKQYKVLYGVDYDEYLQNKEKSVRYSNIIFTENDYYDEINYNNKTLDTYTIPISVTVIGKEAFYQQSIKLITIPTNVNSISDSCFSYCGSLTTINLPSTITSIGNDCFRGCNALSTIDFPSLLCSIGDSCFRGCDKLKSVVLPYSLTLLGDYCFLGC